MSHVSVKWVHDIVVVEPRGSGQGLSGGEETEELQEVLQTLDKEATRHAVINLGRIAIMNSLAMSVLVRAHLRFRARGAEIKLSSLCDRLDALFVITKLRCVFDVYATEREAIDSFKAEAGGRTPLQVAQPAAE